MRFQGLFLSLIFALTPSARAQTLPPLDQQKTWTEADKKEFLRYLNSNQAMPKGDVKNVPVAAGGKWTSRSARAVQVGPEWLVLFPSAGGRYASPVSSTLGGRVLYEQHFAPWLRGYAGLQVDPLTQKRLDGGTARLTRWAVPAGLELALVPLNTPQTRYVLLRLGMSAAEISGTGGRSDFAAPLLGTSAAWNLGLGYEWQIANSRWRINGTLDALRSVANRGGVGYYGAGAAAAAVYTF